MGKTDLCKQLLLGCIIAALSTGTSKSLAAADVMVGVDVPAGKQVPLNRIEHSVWDSLLKQYIDDRGMVQYAAWKQNAGDVQALDQYLQLRGLPGWSNFSSKFNW